MRATYLAGLMFLLVPAFTFSQANWTPNLEEHKAQRVTESSPLSGVSVKTVTLSPKEAREHYNIDVPSEQEFVVVESIKLATLATLLTSPPDAANFSTPSMKAAATSSYTSCANSSVTLTLIPSLISWRNAGMPSAVPGTLIITFPRATLFHRRRASSMVPLVSCARYGDTSRLT